MRKFEKFFVVSVLSIISIGCDYLAQNTPFTSYESHGISFQYPLYWEVVEDQINKNYALLEVYGPLGTTILLSFVSNEGEPNLEKYARLFSNAFMENALVSGVDETAFVPVKDELGDHSLDGIREVFVAEIDGIEVPIIRNYFMLNREEGVAYLVFQTDDDNSFEAKLIGRIKKSFLFQ